MKYNQFHPASLDFCFSLGYIGPSTFPEKQQESPAVQEDLSADEISHLLLVTQCPGF